MGHGAGREAFSIDTYHFHAKQCSECWEPLEGELEQGVVLGKGDFAALVALFVFNASLITSPSGGFFSLFCMLERAKRAASAFCSFSSSSLSQCEPGRNIIATD